jgi:hypothetical protein
MKLLDPIDQIRLMERVATALERIADAMEKSFPEAEDTEFDPNQGTVDSDTDTPPEKDENRKVKETDIIEAEDVAY